MKHIKKYSQKTKKYTLAKKMKNKITIRTKDKSLFLFGISILLMLFDGAHAWFLWGIDFKILIYINLAISILFALKHKRRWLKFNNVTIGCLFLAATMVYNRANYSLLGIILALGYVTPLYLLASCSNEHQRYILNLCLKVLCFILVPSMILHVIFLVVGFPQINPIQNSASENYLFYNYFFLIHNYVMDNYQIRFCSIFLEPGYAATLFVFLLYANGMNIKNKYNKILTLALALTLSLAGYVVYALAWAFTALCNGVIKRKYIITLLIFIGSYFIAINYNQGDNILNDYIFSRLEINDEGKLEGNNRNTFVADDYFDFLTSNGEIWTGIGDAGVGFINGGKGDYNTGNSTQILGAGYVIYFIKFGIISALMALLGYLFLGLKGNKRYNFFFIVLIGLTFWQASYPLSGSWLIPYIFGVFLDRENGNELETKY